MDDLARDEFVLRAKWELEGEDDNDDICIKEGRRNIGGTQLRKPAVRPAEFVEGEYGATKKNYKLTLDFPPFISQRKQPILNRSGKPIKVLMASMNTKRVPIKSPFPTSMY